MFVYLYICFSMSDLSASSSESRLPYSFSRPLKSCASEHSFLSVLCIIYGNIRKKKINLKKSVTHISTSEEDHVPAEKPGDGVPVEGALGPVLGELVAVLAPL